MKTLYKCEICGYLSPEPDLVSNCETMCKMTLEIPKAFDLTEWCPPLPFHRFTEWTKGDKVEFCRRLDKYIASRI